MATSALWQHTSVTDPGDWKIWTSIPTASERGPNIQLNNPRVVAVGPVINYKPFHLHKQEVAFGYSFGVENVRDSKNKNVFVIKIKTQI